jgi:hypothetical protein
MSVSPFPVTLPSLVVEKPDRLDPYLDSTGTHFLLWLNGPAVINYYWFGWSPVFSDIGSDVVVALDLYVPFRIRLTAFPSSASETIPPTNSGQNWRDSSLLRVEANLLPVPEQQKITLRTGSTVMDHDNKIKGRPGQYNLPRLPPQGGYEVFGALDSVTFEAATGKLIVDGKELDLKNQSRIEFLKTAPWMMPNAEPPQVVPLFVDSSGFHISMEAQKKRLP